jgi:hypothetical protein
MTVETAWKRQDMMRGNRIVFMKMTYDNGDSSVVADTGLTKIYSYDISPTSVTAKTWDYAEVADGTITITVADPLAPCYLFVTAEGI